MKRGSEIQLNKDNFDMDQDDSTPSETFQMASESKIKQRMIKKPVSRLQQGQPQPTAPMPKFNFKPSIPSTGGVSQKENTEKLDLLKAVRGLNHHFLTFVESAYEKDTFVDLSRYFERYTKYRDDLKNKYPTEFEALYPDKNVALNPPLSATPAKPAPKFSFGAAKETPAKFDTPRFSFGSSNQVNSQPQETPSKPSFTFGSTSMGSSSVLPGPSTSSVTGNFKSPEKPTFSFKPTADSKEETKAPKKPEFTFGSSEKKEEPAPQVVATPVEPSEPKKSSAVTFGSNNDVSAPVLPSKLAFPKAENVTFGSSSDIKELPSSNKTAGVFSDSKESAKQASPVKPVFSFGTSTASEKQKAVEADKKPMFTFGAANPSPSVTPAFSFSMPSEKKEQSSLSFTDPEPAKKKPEFAIPTPAASKESLEEPKGGFTFGSTSSITSEIKFGSAPTPKDAKDKQPAFTFGSTPAPVTKEPEIKPPFSFNSQNTEKPAFKFGSAEANAGSESGKIKPSFSFASPGSADKEKPAFSFGSSAATSANDKPNFSFGASPGTPTAFSFGSASSTGSTAPPAFSFNPPASAAFSASQGEDKEAEEDEDPEKKAQEEAASKKAVEAMMKSDEEALEDTLYEVRAKITQFSTESKSWTDVGIGELRIKKHKETAKMRILCRADGSGRILVNASIFSEMIVRKEKEKMVSFVIMKDEQLVKTLARVKTDADAEKLLSALGDAKKSC